jgi:hypothetical protein
MHTLPPLQLPELHRLQRRALIAGVAAFVICLIGALFSPTQFFRAYLAAYVFYLGIGLGAMAILMLYHLTGGAWGFLIRRILEAATRTIPLMAVLFVPIACGVRYLYLWAQPEGKELVREDLRRLYLSPTWFWIRAVVFFVVWIVLGFLLNAWSRRQDETGDLRYGRRLSRLGGPGLVAYGICITFASVDWVMSLQPSYRSTIFGPLFASGQLLTAQAFALFVLAWLLARPPLANLVSLEVLNDLGNLLFTFLIIWAYMAFFQYMLIWIANLPYDISWYLPRLRNGWQWVAWVLVVFHFAIPFGLLLMRDIKQNPAAMVKVAGLLLVMQLVYDYWQVLPAFPGTHLGEHWMDFLTPIALGGPWLAFFLWQLKRMPILPLHDLNQESALHLHRLDQEQAAQQREVQHA